MSQMVDIDWGTSDHHLTDVAANKVASKVFSEMSILCISADFVPSKKSKKVRPQSILAARLTLMIYNLERRWRAEKGGCRVGPPHRPVHGCSDC